jgi:hypothetical protein
MNRIEIRALIQERDDWCVSVIIPNHRTSPDRRVDSEVLNKSIRYAKSILHGKNPPASINAMITTSLDRLALEFDPVHAMDGLGLFVSPEIARLVLFPFPVKEKIIVDNTFEARDLYYLEQFSKPYYVLQLTKDEAHLFLMETGATAREVTNTYFPMKNEQEYEYSRSSLGTSYGFAGKGFEKDKSIVNKTRQQPFFKEVAQNVMPYAKAGDLLVSGAKHILSGFDTLRDRRLKIKGRITSNFKDPNDLFEHARITYFECRQQEIQMMIDSLKELVGEKRVARGVRNVWSAAIGGKGDTLLVEKDLYDEGITLHDGGLASVADDLTKKNTRNDNVDHIIETILDKGGKVIFTEENQLADYDHIALILRY